MVTLYFASARWVLEETLGMARTKGEEDREAKREAVTGEAGGIHILALGQMEIGEDQRRRGQGDLALPLIYCAGGGAGLVAVEPTAASQEQVIA